MNKRFTFGLSLPLSLLLALNPMFGVAVERAVRPAKPSVVAAGPITGSAKPSGASKATKRVVTPPPQAPASAGGQSATLLPDGRWLLAGGEGTDGPSAEAVIKDPRNDSMTPVPGGLKQPRAWHSATLLPDGTVLILGGLGDGGQVLNSAEVFDPETQRFESLSSADLLPRAYHTATLLIDGRVLLAGGVSSGGRLHDRVEVVDSRSKTAAVLPVKLQVARLKHTASLLPDGNFLLWGGADGHGVSLDSGELFDTETHSVSWVGGFVNQDQSAAPRLTASLPEDGASSVAKDARVALRFSKPLRAETVNTETLTLAGPEGKVGAKVFSAENGMLAFITPHEPLRAGTTYTVTLTAAATDRNDLTLVPHNVTFTTAEDESDGHDHHAGHDRPQKQESASSPQSPRASQLATRVAREGAALAGQVLAVGGQHLANVTLQIGNRTTVTDQAGRFLLSSLTPGKHGLVIRGDTASSPGRTYGTFEVLVDVAEGKTTVLPYTIWLPLLDEQHAVRLPAPTTRETVVTTPRVPGMEVRVPARTVLRMPHGHGMIMRQVDARHLMTSLTITPIPVDRPPFALPPGVTDGLLFTLQMHGAKVEGINGEKRPGLRIIFPNIANLSPGARASFWNYDSTEVGWYLYGQGTVTSDGRQVVPDPGVELQTMHCLSLMTKGIDPPDGPPNGGCAKDGDPVDLATGLFVYDKTDLKLPDTTPISLTRTYRQNDSEVRAFGKGATHPYEMYISGDTYNYGQIILPDGGRVRFDNNGSGVYEHTATPTRFYKATMRQISTGGPNGAWEVRLLDGTVYQFGIKVLTGSIFGPTSSITGLTAIIDRYGNKLTIARDSAFRATKITSSNGRWIELTYDGTSPRVVQAKDNIGRVVSYSYDANNRLWKVTDVGGGVTEHSYDAADRLLTIKDARGIVFLTNEYDANGRVKKQTQADGSTYQFVYTLNGSNKVTQTDVTDRRGYVRRVTFNANGYWLTDTYALGQPEQQTITYVRQAGSNFVLSAIDGLGRKTAYTYDSAGKVTDVTRLAETASAVTTHFTYDPRFNQVATVTVDPTGLNLTTTFTYDDQGNLTSVTDPLDHQSSFTYNTAGQLIAATDALQHTAQFIYDGGDLVEVRDELGRRVTRYVDGAGRVTRIRDPQGHVRRYEYNASNQLKKIINPQQGVASFSYDPNGNVLSVTDARGGLTSYTYDNMDRILTRTDPLQGVSSTEQYEYDLASNLTKYIDRRGKITTYRYDALNRRIFAGFGTTGHGEAASYESTITYGYDGYDRLTQAVDSVSGAIMRSYDDLARTMTETTSQGAVGYSFDKLGRLIGKTVTGQASISYDYDEASRLISITQGVSTVSLNYDAANRRTNLTLPNGVSVDYVYDEVSQLTGLQYNHEGTELGNLTYEYDLSGRRVKMGGSFARIGMPQPLTSAAYDASNRLTHWGASAFTYDANGNLTSDGVNSYAWNARNQLVSTNGSVTASFQYDAFGRRISKTVGGKTTNYLYDGLNAVQELSGATPTASMLAGGVDEIFSRTDSTGTLSFITDGLGSTLSLLDPAGSVHAQYTYGAFGDTAITGSNTGNTTAYTGREDDKTELYYYRARYYSPTLQRFISEDPIGFASGDVNFYAYVGNDSINKVDPSGLDDADREWEARVNSPAPPNDPWYQSHNEWADNEPSLVGRGCSPQDPPSDIFQEIFDRKSYEDAWKAQNRNFPNDGNPYDGGYRHCVAACLVVRRYGLGGDLIIQVWDIKNESSNRPDSKGDKEAEREGCRRASGCESCERECLKPFPQ